MPAAGPVCQILCQQLGLFIRFSACSWAYLSDSMPAACVCLSYSMSAAGPTYQILCQQLGLFIRFYACSWACLSDSMPAAVSAYQILCQLLGLQYLSDSMPAAGPANLSRSLQLSLLTEKYNELHASNWA